jgi:hypothetical protein
MTVSPAGWNGSLGASPVWCWPATLARPSPPTAAGSPGPTTAPVPPAPGCISMTARPNSSVGFILPPNPPPPSAAPWSPFLPTAASWPSSRRTTAWSQRTATASSMSSFTTGRPERPSGSAGRSGPRMLPSPAACSWFPALMGRGREASPSRPTAASWPSLRRPGWWIAR